MLVYYCALHEEELVVWFTRVHFKKKKKIKLEGWFTTEHFTKTELGALVNLGAFQQTTARNVASLR